MTIKDQPDLGAGNFTFFVQTSLRIITICLFFTIMYLFYISCYKPNSVKIILVVLKKKLKIKSFKC